MSNLEAFFNAYRAVAREGYNWQCLDQVLWEMCDQTPGHTDVRRVLAKVGLVNRAYRANLQMGVEEAEWKVARRLIDSDIDRHIVALRALTTFDRTTAPVVLDAHRSLVALCKETTSRWALSFASKYLSFHAPRVVPLFDQYAYTEGWKLVRGVVNEPMAGNAAEDYRWHAASVLFLADQLRAQGVEPNVKYIDVVLYGSAGGGG